MSAADQPLPLRTISRIERLENSRNGNPRFRFFFDDATTNDLQSDAAFGYEVGNPGFREGDTVEVSFTDAERVSHMRTPQYPTVFSVGDKVTTAGGTGEGIVREIYSADLYGVEWAHLDPTEEISAETPGDIKLASEVAE